MLAKIRTLFSRKERTISWQINKHMYKIYMVFKSSFLKFVFSCNCTIYFKDFLKRISMWHSLETKLVALPNDNVAGSEYRSGVVVKMGAELAWSLELQAWGWACWWGFNGSVYVKLQISFALRQTISAFNYIDYAAKERIWLSLRQTSLLFHLFFAPKLSLQHWTWFCNKLPT